MVLGKPKFGLCNFLASGYASTSVSLTVRLHRAVVNGKNLHSVRTEPVTQDVLDTGCHRHHYNSDSIFTWQFGSPIASHQTVSRATPHTFCPNSRDIFDIRASWASENHSPVGFQNKPWELSQALLIFFLFCKVRRVKKSVLTYCYHNLI